MRIGFVDSEYGYLVEGKIIAHRVFAFCVATPPDDAFGDFAGYVLVLSSGNWTMDEIKSGWGEHSSKISRDLCRGMIPNIFDRFEAKGLEYRD